MTHEQIAKRAIELSGRLSGQFNSSSTSEEICRRALQGVHNATVHELTGEWPDNTAPNLLAACESVIVDLEHYASTHGPGPDRRLAALRAALARARGEVQP